MSLQGEPERQQRRTSVELWALVRESVVGNARQAALLERGVVTVAMKSQHELAMLAQFLQSPTCPVQNLTIQSGYFCGKYHGSYTLEKIEDYPYSADSCRHTRALLSGPHFGRCCTPSFPHSFLALD